MTFLSKLGGIIATVAGLFAGFGGVIQKQWPGSSGIIETVSKDIAEVGNIVAEVEAFGQLKGLSGADKAKMAGPLVAQVLLSGSLLSGKKIADPIAFQAACVTIAGGVADVLNSVHPDATKAVVQDHLT